MIKSAVEIYYPQVSRQLDNLSDEQISEMLGEIKQHIDYIEGEVDVTNQ